MGSSKSYRFAADKLSWLYKFEADNQTIQMVYNYQSNLANWIFSFILKK